MTFQEQIELYLAPLPSKWKEELTKILCEINASQQTIDCQDIKDCETLTSLSNFSVQGSEISIQYKDERGVTVTRSFDFETILNNSLAELDPNCLTDETTWSNLTFIERLQLLIDSHCDCCSTSSTTTTTTP